MIQVKTERSPESRVLALGFLMVALLAAGLLLTASAARAAATFTVNFTGDEEDHNPGDGVCDTLPHPQLVACTLRAAIEEANETAGADTIDFDIGGSGVKTIKPNSELPSITDEVIINGYSQPGASPNTKAKGTNAVLKIELNGENAGPGAEGLNIKASNSVVRGLVINRFDDDSIRIGSNDPTLDPQGNKVTGNFIGTNPSGTLDRSNEQQGVVIFGEGTSDNTIGGATPAARNLISGNDEAGVDISVLAANNGIKGNLIGTKKDGTGALGNSGSGVLIESGGLGNDDGGFDNVVGGNTSGEANTIAFNGGGVTVSGNDSTGNSILRNSTFSNDHLDIDLGDDGSTPNDPGDGDAGPNDLQNKPRIGTAENSGGETTVEGMLDSKPNETFNVQFFSNPPGTGEGKKYIGTKSVTTDASGIDFFTFEPAKKVPVGRNITATATDPDGNTSEFSVPEEVV